MLDTQLHALTCQYSEERHAGAGGSARPEAADRALIDAVARALGATGYAALRAIDIEISNGIAVLWGRVPTYYQKQLAQVVAQKVDGVRGIANGVEVMCSR